MDFAMRKELEERLPFCVSARETMSNRGRASVMQESSNLESENSRKREAVANMSNPETALVSRPRPNQIHPTAPSTSPPRLIRSRRRRYLELNPSYLATASADLELTGAPSQGFFF